jgi:predicted outer membrane repeat protein
MRWKAIAFFMILSLLAGGAWARTWNVNAGGTGDAPDIQAAIDSCASGDSVLVAPGTYMGAGNRDIDFTGKAIVVTSISGADMTIIDCGGSEAEYHRGFYFHSGEDTTSVLQGFTITNGYSEESGGAIYCIGSSPKILNNVVTDNYAQGGGGGIYCEGTHSIITGNAISNNEVPIRYVATRDWNASVPFESGPDGSPPEWLGGGGNIRCMGDSSLIEFNAITGGTSTWGSAIFCSASFIRVRNDSISGNGGAYTSGTVCFLSGSYEIEDNIIAHNHTWNDGGGLYCWGGTYTIVGNTVRGNSGFGQSSGVGGGMYCGPGSYTIVDNDISYNWTPGAGGIYIAGSGSIRDNRITRNSSDYAGPCKSDLISSANLSSQGLSRQDVGGGILISGAASLVVANNVIMENSAPFGAGIACIDCSPEIIGNLIVDNGAHYNPCGIHDEHGGKGGGICCSNASPVVARNTIYGNSASDEDGYAAGAGIFCTSASSPNVYQNIVAHNDVSNTTNSGGIFCEDAASVPTISCCDVYANSNANYGGTLADQTGLNGNFSLDPLFCGADYGDFGLHILSPCFPGRHPAGEDCGLIGAREASCDYVATLLEGYATSVEPSAITITWTLAQAGENLRCCVLRAEGGEGAFSEIERPGISQEGLMFTFRDTGCDPGTSYRYRVNVRDDEGTRVLFETSEISTPALPLGLEQNFPNPFNPSTAVAYYLPRDSRVELAVFDVSGRRVASLVERIEKKGRHSVIWNGKDETGSSVGSGVYFYRLTAGKETISKKMVLLR